MSTLSSHIYFGLVYLLMLGATCLALGACLLAGRGLRRLFWLARHRRQA